MGAFLEAPITKKDTEAKSGLDAVAAVGSMQGWRKEMEVRGTRGVMPRAQGCRTRCRRPVGAHAPRI